MKHSSCTFEGCSKPARGRGLCPNHHAQAIRKGLIIPWTALTIHEQIAVVTLRVGECLEWQGKPNPNGYGRIGYEGKRWLAHRLAYTLKHGEIPDGLMCCHKCDNRKCVDTNHLFLGTAADNLADMRAKGRQVVPIMVGQNNPRAKLNEVQVIEMRRLHAEGVALAALAKMFDATFASVCSIVHRRTWKHIL